MKKVIYLFALFLFFASCTNTSYNKAGVEQFLESKDAIYWVQGFSNISNLVEAKDTIAIVITKKELSFREKNAIKTYFKEERGATKVKIQYREDYY